MWQFFLALLVFYSAWVSPFEFGFLNEPNKFLAIADNVVNCLFLVDIGLTFFVAYYDKSTYLLEDRFRQIARRYVRIWFPLDLVSSIPYEVVKKVTPRGVKSYGYFSMLRLWRLRRVGAMFARSVGFYIAPGPPKKDLSVSDTCTNTCYRLIYYLFKLLSGSCSGSLCFISGIRVFLPYVMFF